MPEKFHTDFREEVARKMKRAFSDSRRRVLKGSLAAVSGVAVAAPSGFFIRRSYAAEKVSEDDATAQQLEYTHDASTSDARTSDDEFCYNCRYFKGDADDEWAGCDLFPGKDVNGQGWCNTWSAKS